MDHPPHPFQIQDRHCDGASQDKNTRFGGFVGRNVQNLEIGIDKRSGILQPFLLDLGDDTSMCHNMLHPYQDTNPQQNRLKPKCRIDGMTQNDTDHKCITCKMMHCSKNTSFSFEIGFPKNEFVKDPFHYACAWKEGVFIVRTRTSMQQQRELTPQEVEEGRRGINDAVLSATQIQALVRKMDASKAKWRRLKQQGKKTEYEEKVKGENEILYFNYPSLFQMHVEDRLDSTFFEMLGLKRKIERGEITEEQASALVGQQLFQRFVPREITRAAPAPPRMSYEDYYRQSQ